MADAGPTSLNVVVPLQQGDVGVVVWCAFVDRSAITAVSRITGVVRSGQENRKNSVGDEVRSPWDAGGPGCLDRFHG